jgi:pyruvate kinase
MVNKPLRKTKIVCSLGPSSDSDERIRSLILAGMNVARFNFSHGSHEEHKARMDRVKRISFELGMPVALMLDTKGPEIRTGLVDEKADFAAGSNSVTEGSASVQFNAGDTVMVTSDGAFTAPAKSKDEPGRISLSWKDAARKAKPGIKILIADGLLELDVLEIQGKELVCRAANSARIGSKKNVNLWGLHAGLPIIGEEDKSDIAFGAGEGIDFIAASFLSFPHEIAEIREFLHSIKYSAGIIAKIESREGVENIEKIICLSDGIMVARGDLAVQIPDEQIPLVQKRIIGLARKYSKPVITATQMLDSMIVNPRPTRAELTDVANAIFDGTDAVMLSGETANGAYPVEALETMSRIAVTVEESEEYRDRMRKNPPLPGRSGIAENISLAAYETAFKLDAKVIVTPTLSGNSARLIARYRPEQPILAATPDMRSLRGMLLDWGVFPHLVPKADDSGGVIRNVQKITLDSGLASISDKLVLAAGLPIESPLPLNTVRVLIVGNVLTRSRYGGFSDEGNFRVSGRIFRASSAREAREALKNPGGEILVCPLLSTEYAKVLKLVKGIICEGSILINDEILKQLNPGLVWLSGVHNASHSLESGLLVTIDGKAMLVYEGII